VKPFDLMKALAGESVVTRDGRKVIRIAMYSALPGEPVKLYAYMEDGSCTQYPITGRYLGNSGSHHYDLFMSPKMVTKFVILRRHGTDLSSDSWMVASVYSEKGLADTTAREMTVGSPDIINAVIEIQVEE
jgi:hypothetical protein